MDFSSLPDELLYEMCENWNTGTLLNMSESYSKVYQICSNIIKERKEQFIQQKYGKVLEFLNSKPLNIDNLDIRKFKLDTLKYLNLDRFINLQELYCSDNQLTSLQGLENCTSLQELYCSDNQLTSLQGLENCINLWELNCNYNNLTSLEGLENCINLQTLDCDGNKLTSLHGLENCINLRKLFCKYNNLTTLKGLENCINLNTLDCRYNQLTSLDYLPKSVVNIYK